MKRLKKILREIPLVLWLYRRIHKLVYGTVEKPPTLCEGGAYDARYCYTVWMRHLYYLKQQGMTAIPSSVAELGPGGSLGVGLCAILSGVNFYYAYDVVKYANSAHNKAVFEELVKLFRNRESIPDNAEFPAVQPYIEKGISISTLLTDDLLDDSLSEERINLIRDCLDESTKKTSIGLSYVAPWIQMVGNIPQVELIISQAVLEHVDELESAYEVMGYACKSGGFMSHSIDFGCHGTAPKQNGHWAYSKRKWNKMKGDNPYSLNRQPLSAHLRLSNKNGFNTLLVKRMPLEDGMPFSQIHRQFQGMTQDDFNTRGAFVVLQKQ